VKIGSADLEIICLREIIKKDLSKDKKGKKERNYGGKIYSPFDNFAERAKLEMRGLSAMYPSSSSNCK